MTSRDEFNDRNQPNFADYSGYSISSGTSSKSSIYDSKTPILSEGTIGSDDAGRPLQKKKGNNHPVVTSKEKRLNIPRAQLDLHPSVKASKGNINLGRRAKVNKPYGPRSLGRISNNPAFLRSDVFRPARTVGIKPPIPDTWGDENVEPTRPEIIEGTNRTQYTRDRAYSPKRNLISKRSHKQSNEYSNTPPAERRPMSAVNQSEQPVLSRLPSKREASRSQTKEKSLKSSNSKLARKSNEMKNIKNRRTPTGQSISQTSEYSTSQYETTSITSESIEHNDDDANNIGKYKSPAIGEKNSIVRQENFPNKPKPLPWDHNIVGTSLVENVNISQHSNNPSVSIFRNERSFSGNENNEELPGPVRIRSDEPQKQFLGKSNRFIQPNAEPEKLPYGPHTPYAQKPKKTRKKSPPKGTSTVVIPLPPVPSTKTDRHKRIKEETHSRSSNEYQRGKYDASAKSSVSPRTRDMESKQEIEPEPGTSKMPDSGVHQQNDNKPDGIGIVVMASRTEGEKEWTLTEISDKVVTDSTEEKEPMPETSRTPDPQGIKESESSTVSESHDTRAAEETEFTDKETPRPGPSTAPDSKKKDEGVKSYLEYKSHEVSPSEGEITGFRFSFEDSLDQINLSSFKIDKPFSDFSLQNQHGVNLSSLNSKVPSKISEENLEGPEDSTKSEQRNIDESSIIHRPGSSKEQSILEMPSRTFKKGRSKKSLKMDEGRNEIVETKEPTMEREVTGMSSGTIKGIDSIKSFERKEVDNEAVDAKGPSTEREEVEIVSSEIEDSSEKPITEKGEEEIGPIPVNRSAESLQVKEVQDETVQTKEPFIDRKVTGIPLGRKEEELTFRQTRKISSEKSKKLIDVHEDATETKKSSIDKKTQEMPIKGIEDSSFANFLETNNVHKVAVRSKETNREGNQKEIPSTKIDDSHRQPNIDNTQAERFDHESTRERVDKMTPSESFDEQKPSTSGTMKRKIEEQSSLIFSPVSSRENIPKFLPASSTPPPDKTKGSATPRSVDSQRKVQFHGSDSHNPENVEREMRNIVDESVAPSLIPDKTRREGTHNLPSTSRKSSPTMSDRKLGLSQHQSSPYHDLSKATSPTPTIHPQPKELRDTGISPVQNQLMSNDTSTDHSLRHACSRVCKGLQKIISEVLYPLYFLQSLSSFRYSMDEEDAEQFSLQHLLRAIFRQISGENGVTLLHVVRNPFSQTADMEIINRRTVFQVNEPDMRHLVLPVLDNVVNPVVHNLKSKDSVILENIHSQPALILMRSFYPAHSDVESYGFCEKALPLVETLCTEAIYLFVPNIVTLNDILNHMTEASGIRIKTPTILELLGFVDSQPDPLPLYNEQRTVCPPEIQDLLTDLIIFVMGIAIPPDLIEILADTGKPFIYSIEKRDAFAECHYVAFVSKYGIMPTFDCLLGTRVFRTLCFIANHSTEPLSNLIEQRGYREYITNGIVSCNVRSASSTFIMHAAKEVRLPYFKSINYTYGEELGKKCII